MQTLHYKEKEIAYTGEQLRSHWIYQRFQQTGDCLVAFYGPADVSLDHMVDLEDVANKAPIGSPQMVHFLGEWFDDSLEVAILRQHLLASIVYEWLWENGVSSLRRNGNDIFVAEKKLSVSIATKTLVSTLVHLGVNVKTEGTPIPTSGLLKLGIDPHVFTESILNCFQRDYHTWQKARVKVLPR